MSFLTRQPTIEVEGWKTNEDHAAEAARHMLRGKIWESYTAYLAAIKHRLPSAVYEFAIAGWHYDFSDPRCPHDAWVQEVKVREIASGERQEIRHTQIEILLLGAYHDRLIKFTYFDVGAYNLLSPHMRHDDWLVDEIRLSESGQVIHEVEFQSNALWTIECGDMRVEEQMIESAEDAAWKD